MRKALFCVGQESIGMVCFRVGRQGSFHAPEAEVKFNMVGADWCVDMFELPME